MIMAKCTMFYQMFYNSLIAGNLDLIKLIADLSLTEKVPGGNLPRYIK